MNKDSSQIYDRNIRLWGKEIQEMILHSNVLLINLSSTAISEVAKNLILSGVNLILFDEGELVQIQDIGSNFFFCIDDINKSKATTLQRKLLAINPLVTIRIYSVDDLRKSPNDIQCAVYDNQGILYSPIELVLKEHRIITYFINIQRQKGFFINNIEVIGTREVVKKKDNKRDYITLDEDNEKDDGINLLVQKKRNEPVEIDQEEIILEDNSEHDDLATLEGGIKKMITKEELVYCTQMEKFRLITKQLRDCQVKIIESNVNQWLYLSKYIFSNQNERNGLDSEVKDECPLEHQFFSISCIIAGLASLEVIKVVSMSDLPNCNLYAYDSDVEHGDFFLL